MTILEQRFLETVPSQLKQIEVGLEQLNETLTRLNAILEEATSRMPELDSDTLHDSRLLKKTHINSSEQAAELLRKNLQNLDHEELWILLLNNSLQPIKKVRLCVGTLTSTLIDYRRLTTEALNAMATDIIAFHNHPSNNVKPSLEDIRATNKMRTCLDCFDIKLADHIIFGCNGETYYSFAEEKVQSLK